MKREKLLELFFALTQREVRELGKFLNSPYHNQHPGVCDLYEILASSEGLGDITLGKEELFEALYPGEGYDDLRLRHLKSLLLKLILEFIQVESLKRSPLEGHLREMRTFNHLGLEKLHRSSFRAFKRVSDKEPLRNTEHHYLQYRFYEEAFNTPGIRKEGERPEFQLASDTLDIFYLSAKMRLSCTILTQSVLFKEHYDLGLIEELTTYISQKGLEVIPAIGAWYYCYGLLTDPDNDEQFSLLKSLLNHHLSLFRPDEARALYLHTINFCIRKMNDGQQDYTREVFDLYQKALGHQVLLIEGNLSPWTFKNIVSTGLKLEEYAWVETFIFKYRALLPEEKRNSFFSFCLARWLFCKKRFAECARQLFQTNFHDLFILFDARVLQAKALYEMEELTRVESLLSSFEQVFRRKDLKAYHRDKYQSFIRIFRRLLNLNQYNREEVLSFAQDLNSDRDILEWDWLKEKVEKL